MRLKFGGAGHAQEGSSSLDAYALKREHMYNSPPRTSPGAFSEFRRFGEPSTLRAGGRTVAGRQAT